jgi:hypothetical protein
MCSAKTVDLAFNLVQYRTCSVSEFGPERNSQFASTSTSSSSSIQRAIGVSRVVPSAFYLSSDQLLWR